MYNLNFGPPTSRFQIFPFARTCLEVPPGKVSGAGDSFNTFPKCPGGVLETLKVASAGKSWRGGREEMGPAWRLLPHFRSAPGISPMDPAPSPENENSLSYVFILKTK